MNRFRLGLIVLTVLMTVGFLTVAAVVRRPGGGGGATIPEPVSYAKPTPDGRFVLVAFGNPEAEAKLTGETKRYAVDVRAKYPTPGLYAAGDPSKPVYELGGYSPDDQVYLSADGRHVIRVEGDWWKTKAYPAGKRLPPEVEQAQLDAAAVRHFTDGKLTHEYALKELVEKPADLPHSPDHILWPAGASLNTDTGQFHLFTQDANRITFDLNTGEIVARGKTGLGNPAAGWLIGVTIALTAALAAVLLWYTFVKRPLSPVAANTTAA